MDTTQSHFLHFKPFCIACLQKPTWNALKITSTHPLLMLKTEICRSSASSVDFDRLTPFLFFPLLSIARCSKSLSVVELVLEIMAIILQRVYYSSCASHETVKQIMTILPIIGLDNQSKYQSEEMKLKICQILKLIANSFSNEKETVPIIAHNITMLIDFIEKNPFFRLSEASTAALLEIFKVIHPEVYRMS